MAGKISSTGKTVSSRRPHLSAPRRDILQKLDEHGPRSVTEIAEELGRPADGLYYHFRILRQNGHIEIHETRKSRRREESVYRLSREEADQSEWVQQPRSREEVGSLLRAAGREYERAVLDEDAKSAILDVRDHIFSRRTAWLNRTAVKKVELILAELDRVLQAGDRSDDAQLFSLTYLFSPLEAHPSRRQSDQK